MISPVRKMFDGIASRYDFLNHFLSCGQDVLWRRACCRELRHALKNGDRALDENCAGEKNCIGDKKCASDKNCAAVRLLDLCGGTGDFAVTFEKFCGKPAKAILGDFSYGMLRGAAGKKTSAAPVQLDAMKMPFADSQFDVILNGFGMRNLPDARGGLQESFRILDNGGYLCVLEFFSPRNVFNKFFYKVLAPLFIPVMGAFFSGKREAYEYLVNSIIRFLPVDEFCRLAEECGFEVKRVKMFDGGISFGVFLQKPQKAADASQGSVAR
ncbi:MAG: class I SAM-dependent methyltransferase [Fibrobacter sp.]|nr:class I SAM-dependent methyltransferase [Fibrobacter sp.]